jgi:hypothetical protein
VLAGKRLEAKRVKLGLSIDSSKSFSGDGTHKFGWAASLQSYSIFNIASLINGIRIEINSTELTPVRNARIIIPSLSIDTTNTIGSYEDYVLAEVFLVDFLLYETFLGLWRMSIGSVEFKVNGVLVATLGGGTLDSTGLGPGYVPLLGIPPKVTGSLFNSVTGLPSNYSYSYTQEGNVHCSYGIQINDGDSYIYMPVSVPSSVIPSCFSVCTYCMSMPAIVQGTTTENIVLHLKNNGTKVFAITDTTEYDEGTSERQYGSFWVVPNLDKSVVKLGDSYGSLIQRGGIPYTKYTGKRLCITSDSSKIPAPPPPRPNPYSETATSTGNLTNSYSAYLDTVFDTASIIEDPLGETSWLPVDITYDKQYLLQQIPTIPNQVVAGETLTFVYPSKVQHRTKYGDPNSDMLGYLSWDDGVSTPTEINNIITYVSYNTHPHWSYFYHPRNWNVDGSSVNWETYWAPIGDQFLSHPSLPGDRDVQKRTSLVSAPLLEGGNSSFIESIAFGKKTSWWGLPTFDIDRPSIPSSITAELSTARWSSSDAIISTESGKIKVTSSGPSTLSVNYNLADWNSYPRLLPLLTKEFVFNWDSTNVSSIKVFAVGSDGVEWQICSSPGTYPWSTSLINKKYSGSWIQDWGLTDVTDIGTDIPVNGESVVAYNNNIRVINPQVLSARGAKSLRFEIVFINPATPVKIHLPVFNIENTWNIYQESRQFGCAINENGSCFRFGQSNFWNYLLNAFEYPPSVLQPGSQTTVLDWLCFKRVVLEGIGPTDSLLTELNSLYKLHIEWNTLIHIANDTTAWICNYGDNNDLVQAVLSNTLQPPPLMMFPCFDRDSNLTPTSNFCMKVWAFDQMNRYHITPKVTSDNVTLIKSPGSNWLITDTSEPNGWTVRYHQHVVDNSETDYKLSASSKQYANLRPWHGFFFVGNDDSTSSTNGVDIVHDRNTGEYFYCYLINNDLWVNRSYSLHPTVEDEITQITFSADVSEPAIIIAPDGVLYVVYTRGTNVYYRSSTDQSLSWNSEILLFSGKSKCRIATNHENNDVVFVAFGYVSGTSGPGYLYSIPYGGGDISLPSPTIIKDQTATNIVVADEQFDISYISGQVYLLCKLDGSSLHSHYSSKDGGLTFDKIF